MINVYHPPPIALKLRTFCSFDVWPLDILHIIKLCTTAKTDGPIEYDICEVKHLSGWSVLIGLVWSVQFHVLPSPSFGKLQPPKVGHCGPHVCVVMTQASMH